MRSPLAPACYFQYPQRIVNQWNASCRCCLSISSENFQYPQRIVNQWNPTGGRSLAGRPQAFSILNGSSTNGTAASTARPTCDRELSVSSTDRQPMEPQKLANTDTSRHVFQYPQRIVNQWNPAGTLRIDVAGTGLSVSSTDRQPMELHGRRGKSPPRGLSVSSTDRQPMERDAV